MSLQRLINDAEYVWDHLKWAEVGTGNLIDADYDYEPPACCVAGAAALLAYTVKQLKKLNDRERTDHEVHRALCKKYGVESEELDGLYAGWDGNPGASSLPFSKRGELFRRGEVAGKALAIKRGLADSAPVR